MNISPLSSSVSQARWLIRVFYGFLLLFVVNDIPAFLVHRFREELYTLWPVSWLNWVPLDAGVHFILAFFLISMFLAALWPQHRFLRIAAFIGLLEYLALKYSYGKIGHSMHLWLSVAAIFIVLPRGWMLGEHASSIIQRRTLQVFLLAQAFILLTYSMSGLGKIAVGAYQWINGEYHSFHPMALALHTSDRLWQTHIESVLGEWAINYPYWGWPFFLGAIYIQFASFFVAKRPELHRLWGILLISIHIGIAASMGIFFNEAIFILFLFLVLSPFERGQFTPGQRLRSLPGISWRKRNEEQLFASIDPQPPSVL